ncbi:MAG: prepilin peptidase, partial [Clostridia bacterium]
MNVPAVLLFIAGLGFGALFARVGLVVPVKQSLVRPIACCPQCQKPLKIPVLFAKHDANYKGEGCSCRRSGERIMFLLLTLLAGALFALAYQLFWAKPPEFALAILLVLLSVTITVSDLLYARIPNVVLLGFVPFVVVL